MTAQELEPGEVLLEDADELLFRQAAGALYDPQARQPANLAFGPQKVDQRKPSFSRSSVTTAQESRDWHNANARSRSHGVWACSVGEVDKSHADMRAVDDSAVPVAEDEVKAPGHAFADFRGMGKADMNEVRLVLLAQALARGEIHTN